MTSPARDETDRRSLRRHYLTVAREYIDRQIAELRERRADIDIEIIRVNQEKVNALP